MRSGPNTSVRAASYTWYSLSSFTVPDLSSDPITANLCIPFDLTVPGLIRRQRTSVIGRGIQVQHIPNPIGHCSRSWSDAPAACSVLGSWDAQRKENCNGQNCEPVIGLLQYVSPEAYASDTRKMYRSRCNESDTSTGRSTILSKKIP